MHGNPENDQTIRTKPAKADYYRQYKSARYPEQVPGNR
jgi:hypothetical protein